MEPIETARGYVRTLLQRRPTGALALRAGLAAYKAGAEEIAVAVWSVGESIDSNMLKLEHDPRAPQELKEISALAAKAFRRHFTRLHIDAMEDFARRHDADVSRIRDAVWPLTHDGEVAFREPLQRPTVFYVPGLPASPVEPRERFSWIADLEARFSDVRSEYQNAMREDIAMAPYVHPEMRGEDWSKLRGAMDWSAIHLFKNAERTEHAVRFPKTVDALSAVDLVSIDGVPLEAFFSRLKPGAHIPPHHGLTNSRMTVHFPVDAPADCLIRVGDVEHRWRDGEIVAFDDSFEHEAWNRSDRDRVVLIFEAPHPDLTPAERAAVEHAYSVRQAWNRGRRELLERFAAGG